MTTRMTTHADSIMAIRKTAIAVPEELLEAVDRAAAERGESRSRFINRVLREAVRARRDAAITARLDALFASEDMQSAQRQAAEALDDAAVDWNDERW